MSDFLGVQVRPWACVLEVMVRTRVAGASALVAAFAVVVGLAATPVASPAAATSSDYKIAKQTLPDGRTVLARWNPCQTITFRVNASLAGSTTSARNAAIADVKAAFSKASYATGITFRYAGTTSQIPKNTSSSWFSRQTSAEIVVAWVKQSSSSAKTDLLGRAGSAYAAGTGGYAYKFWKVGNDPWTGATGRGFVVLDSSQNKKFRNGFGQGATRGGLLMHEIGHSLGLLHVGATSQLMYPTMLSRSSTAYASGDLNGLRHVGKSAGCVTTPTWVWAPLS